jgi:hypothetical protein
VIFLLELGIFPEESNKFRNKKYSIVLFIFDFDYELFRSYFESLEHNEISKTIRRLKPCLCIDYALSPLTKNPIINVKMLFVNLIVSLKLIVTY